MYSEEDGGDAAFGRDDSPVFSNDRLEREMLSKIRQREEEMEALRKLLASLEELRNKPKPATAPEYYPLYTMRQFLEAKLSKLRKIFMQFPSLII